MVVPVCSSDESLLAHKYACNVCGKLEGSLTDELKHSRRRTILQALLAYRNVTGSSGCVNVKCSVAFELTTNVDDFHRLSPRPRAMR